MSDLLTRLENSIASWEDCTPVPTELEAEAIKEIKRLRAEVERLEKGIDLIANTYGRYPAWYTRTAHNVLKGIEESDDE